MIGKLIFKLPEEQEEFETAQLGGALKSALQEFDNYLRGRLKYEELSDEVEAALQAARDKLGIECTANNFSLWS
jgi:hypothetical protein